MLFALYVMVSIPEAKIENVFTPPIILGVFDSRESAKNAWKQRGAEFKNIKAKTLHTYYETLETESETLPDSVYLWATYQTYHLTLEEKPVLAFTPYHQGFMDSYEKYEKQKEWLDSMPTKPWREICESSGFTFYASNDNIIEKFEMNKLVKVQIEFDEVNEEYRKMYSV